MLKYLFVMSLLIMCISCAAMMEILPVALGFTIVGLILGMVVSEAIIFGCAIGGIAYGLSIITQ